MTGPYILTLVGTTRAREPGAIPGLSDSRNSARMAVARVKLRVLYLRKPHPGSSVLDRHHASLEPTQRCARSLLGIVPTRLCPRDQL